MLCEAGKWEARLFLAGYKKFFRDLPLYYVYKKFVYFKQGLIKITYMVIMSIKGCFFIFKLKGD